MISRDQVLRAFCDKLAEHGIAVSDPSRLELDGNWHRAHVEGDRGRAENLSYRIHFDDRPAGFFEDHKRGVSGTFTVTNGEDLDPAARVAAQAAWRARQREREAERETAYRDAAVEAQRALDAAQPATAAHPYLTRKQIQPGPKLRVDGQGRLLIPVFTDLGVLSSYQSISADGDKLFMTGGRMAGAFHPIVGTDQARVLVCEGYATGAALTRATGHPAACAMSAGNLAAVVRKMRERFPDREVIACPDNDHGTEQRTGQNPGLAAAQDLGVRVVAPAFPADADPKHTDWDDWLRHHGTAGELRDLIAGPVLPDEPAVDPPSIATSEPPIDLLPRTITADLVNAADPDADGLPEMYSEDNVALRFSQLFADDLRYVAPWGRWMRWRDQRWCHEDTLEVFDLSRKVCRSVAAYVRTDTSLSPKQQATVAGRYGLSATVASVERFAKADRRHAATTSQWDADIWSLNTPAGVVNLRTGAVTPGDRLAYMTKITRVAPGGACPTWLKFLHTATNGDAELIAFLQRMAGYCLTGSTRDHALFFVYGTGGNGKGTFLNTLQWIIGDYAKAAAMDVFTEKKHESHPTELAGLMGARMVTAQETEEGKRWAEARIKALTGGDPITARFMRQDNFEFIPQFKLVIAGNHKPGLRNVDEAIKRRLHLIPFTVTIAPGDRDARLGEKLQAEAGGILQWAIDGCLDWLRNGLQAPAAVIAATDEYLDQQDSLGAWIEECCIVGANEKARRGDLYRSFKGWAERTGEYVLPQKRWVAAIETRGIKSKMRDGIQFCEGLRVKTDASGSQWGSPDREFD